MSNMKNRLKSMAAVVVMSLIISALIMFPFRGATPAFAQLNYLDQIAMIENSLFGCLQSSATPITCLASASSATAQVAPALYNSGTLTAAQIQGMNATPVTLIAGKAGTALEVEGLILMPVAAVTTFGSGGTISFVYTGGSVNVLGTNTLAASNLTSLSNGTEAIYKLGGGTAVTITKDVGADLTNASGAFTGTGTMKYFTKYRYITY